MNIKYKFLINKTKNMKKLKKLIEKVRAFFGLFSQTQIIIPEYPYSGEYKKTENQPEEDPKVVILHNPGSINEPAKIDTLPAVHSNGGKKHVAIEIKKKPVAAKKKPATKKVTVPKKKSKKQGRKKK